MAISNKAANELLRAKYVEKIGQILYDFGEEVLQVKSNELAIPVVDCNDEEKFVVLTIKVPTGANKGLEVYDGYELAKDYIHNLEEKERKKKEREQAKAMKIARDKEIRRKRKEIAEKGGK